MKNYQPIGEMLMHKGKLAPEQLDKALREQRGRRQRLGEVLVALGFVSEEDIAQCLGEQFGFEMVDPMQLAPEPGALELIDPDFALSHRILPVRNTEAALECVIADPIDVPTTDTIMRLVHKRTIFYISPASALLRAICQAYGLDSANLPACRQAASCRRGPRPQKDRDALLALVDTEASRMTSPVPRPSVRRRR